MAFNSFTRARCRRTRQLILATVVAAALAAPAAAQTVPFLPEKPELLKTYPIRAESANRGVMVTVLNAAKLQEYGTYTAPPGKSLLVLSTEWENTIPLTYIQERKEAIGTAYQIPKLDDHVYLVLNSREVVRLSGDTGTLPGHVPLVDFKLPKIGDRLRGNLVFVIPDRADVGWAELRYYDFAHGHISLPLGDPAVEQKVRSAAKPLSPPQKNEVLEGAVYGLQKVKSLNGKEAPSGQTYVVLDFRATSQFTFEGDATGFDPKAAKGSKMKIGTVADWTEALRYASLVVDGEVTIMPVAQLSTLGEAPRFLPDLPTGGSLVFLAPENYKSLELKCDFPNGRTPDGQIIHPAGLTFLVDGTVPTLDNVKPIHTIEDDIFVVHVLRQRRLDTFANKKAEEGKLLLVLDIAVQNRGTEGETFQTKDQIRRMAGETQEEADPLTWIGPRPATELLFIPPGERRSFQMVFMVPADEAKTKLGYNGISKGEVVELPEADAK